MGFKGQGKPSDGGWPDLVGSWPDLVGSQDNCTEIVWPGVRGGAAAGSGFLLFPKRRKLHQKIPEDLAHSKI